VLDGQADAAAIDSHVLAVLLARRPDLRERLRVLTSLGPSTIPPLVVARSLARERKEALREALLSMHLHARCSGARGGPDRAFCAGAA
jgi:phosphonate transport system substrate-binding protein